MKRKKKMIEYEVEEPSLLDDPIGWILGPKKKKSREFEFEDDKVTEYEYEDDAFSFLLGPKKKKKRIFEFEDDDW